MKNKYPELNSVEECLDAAMQIVMDNKRAVMHIYNSDNRNTYVSSLWRMCEATVTTYFNTAFTDDRLSNEDRQLLIRYHKCECFGLILDWINNGLREDYVEGTRRLCQMKKGSVEDMIRRGKTAIPLQAAATAPGPRAAVQPLRSRSNAVRRMIPASLYDIGITAEYGDELLVLSTCSHHTTDGRFVVVAKRVS